MFFIAVMYRCMGVLRVFFIVVMFRGFEGVLYCCDVRGF